MARTIGIGIQSFEKIIRNQYLYIDKTSFIRQWWESGDDVTLITRPRRFGKTLNMNMLERFLSVEYAGRIVHMGGCKVSRSAGNLPGYFSEFCGCEGEFFCDGKGKNLYADQRALQQA